MRLNKKQLTDDLLPILGRYNRQDEAKKEAISYFMANGVADISTAVNFLNGNCDYLALSDEQYYGMVQGLLKIYDENRISYSLDLNSYMEDIKEQPRVTYNRIYINNCTQINDSMYLASLNGDHIYDLFFREVFDFDYLASIPELKIKIDQPDKMLTAGNELKISKMAKEIMETPEVPITMQLNVWGGEEGEIEYSLKDKQLIIGKIDLNVIDVGSFYSIYALSKISGERIRSKVQVNCIIYKLDEMLLDGYRQRYAASLAINAKYFEVQSKKSLSLIAIEDIQNRPGMKEIITSTGSVGIKANGLLYYFKKYFEKREDLEDIKDLFVGSLKYMYDQDPQQFKENYWSVRDVNIICRTVDMCSRKGIFDPVKVGELLSKLLVDRDFKLRVTYRNLAESCFRDFDRRLEELL